MDVVGRNMFFLVNALLSSLLFEMRHLVGSENLIPINPTALISPIAATTISEKHKAWVVGQCNKFRESFITEENCKIAKDKFEQEQKTLEAAAAIVPGIVSAIQQQQRSPQAIFPVITSLKVVMPGLLEEVDITISPVPEKNTVQPQWLWDKYRKYCPIQNAEDKKSSEESMLRRVCTVGLVGVAGLAVMGVNPLLMLMHPSPLMSSIAVPAVGFVLLNQACKKLFDWAEDAEYKNLDDEDKECQLAEEEFKFTAYIRDVFRAIRDSYNAKSNEEYGKELVKGVAGKYEELVAVHKKKGELFDKSLPILKAVINSLPSTDRDNKHGLNKISLRSPRLHSKGGYSLPSPSALPESPPVVTMDVSSLRNQSGFPGSVSTPATSPKLQVPLRNTSFTQVISKQNSKKRKSKWRWAREPEITGYYTVCKKCRNTGVDGVASMGIGSICGCCGANCYQINNEGTLRLRPRQKIIAKYGQCGAASKKSCLCADKQSCSHTN